MHSLTPSGKLAKLFSLHKNVQPTEFVLKTNICTIGRYAKCDIVVKRQKTVSRLHARIERKGPRYFLYDDNSANGTFVNGSRIHKQYLLKHDDMIGLGSSTALLRFIDPDPTAPAQSRIYYNERTMVFSLDQHPLNLTPNEFRLLYHLYFHAGDVCTRAGCAKTVWKLDYDPGPDDENLDRTISNIRSKLRRIDPGLKSNAIIRTRRGIGYELII